MIALQFEYNCYPSAFRLGWAVLVGFVTLLLVAMACLMPAAPLRLRDFLFTGLVLP
jgi:hypothetical protein